VIVLDASAVVELILNTEAGRRVAREIGSPGVSVHAPQLLDIEVAQTLRRYVRTRVIDPGRGETAVDHFRQLDVARYNHEDLLPRIWALRENLTAYDAAYVALAEALGATLLTLDAHLANAPGHRAHVRLPE
jgi:predicted nucleic acid-binding protein